jgi:hypothetical protein
MGPSFSAAFCRSYFHVFMCLCMSHLALARPFYSQLSHDVHTQQEPYDFSPSPTSLNMLYSPFSLHTGIVSCMPTGTVVPSEGFSDAHKNYKVFVIVF